MRNNERVYQSSGVAELALRKDERKTSLATPYRIRREVKNKFIRLCDFMEPQVSETGGVAGLAMRLNSRETSFATHIITLWHKVSLIGG